MDPDPLLKAVRDLLSSLSLNLSVLVGAWLSHGQSYHISYFYIEFQYDIHPQSNK